MISVFRTSSVHDFMIKTQILTDSWSEPKSALFLMEFCRFDMFLHIRGFLHPNTEMFPPVNHAGNIRLLKVFSLRFVTWLLFFRVVVRFARLLFPILERAGGNRRRSRTHGAVEAGQQRSGEDLGGLTLQGQMGGRGNIMTWGNIRASQRTGVKLTLPSGSGSTPAAEFRVWSLGGPRSGHASSPL